MLLCIGDREPLITMRNHNYVHQIFIVYQTMGPLIAMAHMGSGLTLSSFCFKSKRFTGPGNGTLAVGPMAGISPSAGRY